jgi:glycerol-3-phosphate dehydrogenase (NAD(P)+)
MDIKANSSTAVVVLSAGSWGTALAIQFSRAGQQTILWGRAEDQPETLAKERVNQRYLPDIRFPDSLIIETSLKKAVCEHNDILVCVPSHVLRPFLLTIKSYLLPTARLAWATKGFEQKTGKLPHQVAREVLGNDLPLAVLSGPTFASEVGAGLPTAMTVAATDPAFADDLAERISDEKFRAYTSEDLIGVEVGGAVKNVIAIAAGISDGLGYGANTRIALINRGLVEMARLGVALGAQAQTFMGLAGMGDLVLTCTDDQSRNRRMGLGLAAGRSPDDVAKEIGQVVEGIYAAKAVHQVAQNQHVEMPICNLIYLILYENLKPDDAVQMLMQRSLKPEVELVFSSQENPP